MTSLRQALSLSGGGGGAILPVRFVQQDVVVVDKSPDLWCQLVGANKHLLANAAWTQASSILCG
jgi:hypothetical protein